MIENWLLELLWAVGRFFIHPLFYLFFLLTLAYGYFRVKRERRSFHTRVRDLYDEMKFTYTKGILAGLILSIILFAVGLSLPFGAIVLCAIVTAVIGFTFRLRWLSAAFTIGLTFFAISILPVESAEKFDSFLIGLSETSFTSLSILAGLLILTEGVLIFRTAHQHTSPYIKTSTRGLPIGTHESNRTWMLPLLFLVPGGDLTSTLSWWPVLSIGGQPFLLLFIPFFLGFHQRVQGSMPLESIKVTGKRVVWLGVMTLVIAVSSIWFTPAAFIGMFIAMIGREFITIRQRINDDSAAFYFSKRDHGLMILGILPQSPSEKMGLQVGEMVMKVNGYSVTSVEELYQALQKNSAFCKLEIIDFNGEIRFAQRALYDGEHHELGILFVEDDKKWETEAV
ncbi:PDZ domain-containing protein [Metabacillus litoralis]|uniref:PDZ domain-containing protein n=1 Tax=Metabacillus litoralis TaxID=152268 RepID=A0A5C6W3Q5_9BACI|nr:PDZ domain-containing protein [Metabacillus litoralis]TXC91002.1 PDZ domain-containing protein [Metabacillus litoralis]